MTHRHVPTLFDHYTWTLLITNQPPGWPSEATSWRARQDSEPPVAALAKGHCFTLKSAQNIRALGSPFSYESAPTKLQTKRFD